MIDSLEKNLSDEPSSILSQFGVNLVRHHRLTEHGTASPHIHCESQTIQILENSEAFISVDYGNGKIAYATGAEQYSRSGLGHCFAVPGARQRSSYTSFFQMFVSAVPIKNMERRWHQIPFSTRAAILRN